MTDDTFESSVADSKVKAWFRPEQPLCTNAHPPVSLWQMLPWHQMAHAFAILSGIISLLVTIKHKPAHESACTCTWFTDHYKLYLKGIINLNSCA